ncbi:MAG: dockerin type I repeat-containing protein [Kiritimatiellae bacterium]|nr:dockerin type I repeat-containing protein [Kiritimatiellia bacterium]
MRRMQFVLGLILCGWSAWASLPGDVNADGSVDVADLDRARKIASGALAFEAAADVNGDAAITEIDLWLIKEAVLGRPVPELVDSATIGVSGGALSHGDITVSFPPGSTGQNHLSLFRCQEDALADKLPLNNVYMVCGLSTDLAGFTIQYKNCGNNMGLCAGAFMQPYDKGEMKWYWQAFPESGFVRSGTEVSRAFPASGTSDIAITHSVKFAIVTVVSPPPLAHPQVVSASPRGVLTTLSVSGEKYAGYKYTGWRSNLYHVYTKHWGTISYADLESVCNTLHNIHNKIEALGFPLSTTHASKFPLEVYICRDMEDDGGFVYHPALGKWVEVNAKLLTMSNELKATLGHELMHYALEAYQGSDGFAFANIEDSITTWFEAVASDNPDHRSGNYSSRPAAPLKSLFVPITRTWRGSRDWSAQEQHGYGTSAFVDYYFDDHHAWIYELAQKVSGGQTIERALNTLFQDKYGVLYDLERKYLEFARDYLMSDAKCYSSTLNPDAIFASDSTTDLAGMYKLIAIKEASSKLLEEQEVNLTVQDYGCGVVQFKIFKPERIFAPHTRLRVTAPKFSKCVDLLMQCRGGDGVTRSEIVTGSYTQNSEGEDEWSCAITLPDDVIYVLISALVTVGNHGSVTDYTETHDVAMTYQFEGDCYMPMQEMFVRFTELSSRDAYYERQIFSDAIIRMVDPATGLDEFNVQRTTINYPQETLNYTMNAGFSSPVAMRRSPDAFQIRLFSNTKVPELPPFTINIRPSGYSAWTKEGQTPLLAADGTPQLELMVYFRPPAAVDQVIPGNPTHRIQHTITSVGAMRQSADGLTGGVLVDIPSQVSDSDCLIYLIASEADGTLGQTAFVINILPKQTEGQ